MLKSLIENKLPANFIFIQDNEKEAGEALFVAFLKNHIQNESVSKINLFCYENRPEFYLNKEFSHKKVTSYSFNNILGWNEKCSSDNGLSLLTSNSLSDTVVFIDSLSFVVNYCNFYTTFKHLYNLKTRAKKIICLCHSDLFSLSQLEELKTLSTTIITTCEPEKVTKNEKVVFISHQKPGGKVINQRETYVLNKDFQVSSCVTNKPETNQTVNVAGDIRNLTTFKLNIDMSENERRAKEQLILPYLKNDTQIEESGKITYRFEENDLEDDPDDDLDV